MNARFLNCVDRIIFAKSDDIKNIQKQSNQENKKGSGSEQEAVTKSFMIDISETRKVKKEIVNDLMKQGRLFANEYNGLVNCVFLNEDRNYAFLRGTGKKHYADGKWN